MWCRQTDFDLGSGFGGGEWMSDLNYTSPTYPLQTAFGFSAVLPCAFELVLLLSAVMSVYSSAYLTTGLLHSTHVTKGNRWKEGQKH
jgi:hypothetical protein